MTTTKQILVTSSGTYTSDTGLNEFVISNDIDSIEISGFKPGDRLVKTSAAQSFAISDSTIGDNKLTVYLGTSVITLVNLTTDTLASYNEEGFLALFGADTIVDIATPQITLDTDSGVAGDYITNDGSFTVSSLSTTGTIEYSTDGGDTWSTDEPTPLDGLNSISVRVAEEGGIYSQVSTLTFTLDSRTMDAVSVGVNGDSLLLPSEGEGYFVDSSNQSIKLAAETVAFLNNEIVANGGTLPTIALLKGEGAIDASAEVSDTLVIGGETADSLKGSSYNDILDGSAGADTFEGGAGDDHIFGENGDDTAKFDGDYSDYTVQYVDGALKVTDINTADVDEGSDTLVGVNVLDFAGRKEFVAQAASREALTGEETGVITVNTSGLINTTAGAETFAIADGHNVMILAGAGDSIQLESNTADYEFKAAGSQLHITKGNSLIVVNVGGDLTLSTIDETDLAVTLTITDGLPVISLGGNAVSAYETATLADTDAPVFSSGDTATALDENSGATQVVYTASATDDSTVTFSLKGADDAALFSIDGSTGEVTLTGDPDFEIKASYTFTVVATDEAGNASEQAVTLDINDINEIVADVTPPVFTSAATATAIDENTGAQQVVYTAVATDDAAVTYTLKNVDDAALFTIDGSSGAVTLTGDPDFETKDNYAFTVVATDETGNESEQAVTLDINDINETVADVTAPVFTSAATATAIDENTGAQQVVYTAVATDDAAVTYTLKNVDDAALFTIDGSSGAVTLTGDPDFETKDNYAFTVVATDEAGNESEQVVTLDIKDVYEASSSGSFSLVPNFEIYTLDSYPESFTVATFDVISGNTVAWTDGVYPVDGNDNPLFAIDNQNGLVTLTSDGATYLNSEVVPDLSAIRLTSSGSGVQYSAELDIDGLDGVLTTITDSDGDSYEITFADLSSAAVDGAIPLAGFESDNLNVAMELYFVDGAGYEVRIFEGPNVDGTDDVVSIQNHILAEEVSTDITVAAGTESSYDVLSGEYVPDIWA